MIATIAGKADVMMLLMNNGVDITYQIPPPQCWNTLFFAVYNKNKEIAELCMQCGLSPSQRNKVKCVLYHL